MSKLDEIDAKILELLQDRGCMARGAIADRVGRSLPTVSTRISKLEAKGVLTGYHAVVSAPLLRFDTTAFVRVDVEPGANQKTFALRARATEEILEVHTVTGEGSHILKIRTHTTSDLEQLLSEIQSWHGVHGTATSVVLSTSKETRKLPVRPIKIGELQD